MKIQQLKEYKRILILGYGLEGKASESFIKKFHPEAEIGIADQKTHPNFLEVQKDYDLAIRTPTLRPEKITIPYTTGTNLFFGNISNKVIGVTGTKGKSTTVSLLHHVLQSVGMKSRLLGNIGVPMLDALNTDIDPDEIFVIELSSYQLEDIQYSPNIACYLNIYQELHNHPSYENYSESKSHITTFQTEHDTLFFNGKLPEVAEVASKSQAHAIDFTQTSLPDGINDLTYTTHPDNIRAVYAITQSLGVTEVQFTSALHSFTPLAHRIQKVGTYQDITFYDDSGSVHPNATILALQSVQNVGTILLGGQDRGYQFAELVRVLREKDVKNVILFPETDQKIYNEIKNLSNYKPEVIRCSSMDEAVKKAFEVTSKNAICLLSPGAPSYLMYNNLSERGQDFKKIILKYATTLEEKNNKASIIQQDSDGQAT